MDGVVALCCVENSSRAARAKDSELHLLDIV